MLVKNVFDEKWVTEILFDEQTILKRIKELGAWVNETYANSQRLILVGLLKGSIPFIAELMKHIKVPHTLDFMIASSYKGGLEVSDNLKIVMDLEQNINSMDVLVVEDIIDSGRTLKKISEILEQRHPHTLRTITLLNKPSKRAVEFYVDKTGFEVADQFLVGFGLDVKEKLRNLPYIGVFDKSKIDLL
ncbi:hypoxanthine phosphoribosyltransferase [Candidatus Mycoplasma pogonae]